MFGSGVDSLELLSLYVCGMATYSDGTGKRQVAEVGPRAYIGAPFVWKRASRVLPWSFQRMVAPVEAVRTTSALD